LKREKKLTLQARKELNRSSQDKTGIILNLEKKLELGEGLNFAESRGYLMPPVPGKFLNRFGKTRDRKYNTYIVYNGVDIRSPRGTSVRAVFDGKVLFTGTLEGYGNLIIIGHGEDYHSLYGHLDEIITRVGKRVRQGQIIGRSGDTGSLNGETLYFEIRYKGQPIDPVRWFRVAKK